MTLDAMMIPAAGAQPLLNWEEGTFVNASGDRHIVSGDKGAQ